MSLEIQTGDAPFDSRIAHKRYGLFGSGTRHILREFSIGRGAVGDLITFLRATGSVSVGPLPEPLRRGQLGSLAGSIRACMTAFSKSGFIERFGPLA